MWYERQTASQRYADGTVHPIQPGRLVGKLQCDKAGCGGELRGRAAVATVRDHRAAVHVYIILNARVVKGDLHFPPLSRRRVPACRGTQGVGHLGPQVQVTHIRIAIAEPPVHTGRHGTALDPHIALIDAGRAGLPGVTEFESVSGIRFVAGHRSQVEVVVQAIAVAPVEGRGIRSTNDTVASAGFPAPADRGKSP